MRTRKLVFHIAGGHESLRSMRREIRPHSASLVLPPVLFVRCRGRFLNQLAKDRDKVRHWLDFLQGWVGHARRVTNVQSRHWLDYDPVALVVLVVGMSAVALLALSI